MTTLRYIFVGLLLAGCARPPDSAGPVAAGHHAGPTPLRPGRDIDVVANSSPRSLNAIMLELPGIAKFAPPFTTATVPPTDGRLAVELPAGSETEDLSGSIAATLRVPHAGTYRLWAHVYWRDECSNSMGLQLGNAMARTFGQDQVFDAWHWVRAGTFELAPGSHTVRLLEREDGVAIDYLLATTLDHEPGSAPRASPGRPPPQRFADAFLRSPGHGHDDWTLEGDWQIDFTFDPNWVPNQFALVGRATTTPATALIKGHDWSGCRLAFSVLPLEPGTFGAVLDAGSDAVHVRIDVDHESGRVRAGSAEGSAAIEIDQWHRVEIFRWAWLVEVMVDGETVCRDTSLSLGGGSVGLAIDHGAAVFDDVEVDGIAWEFDDGEHGTIAWQLGEDAEWYRVPAGRTADAAAPPPAVLSGRKGWIAPNPEGRTPAAMFLQSTEDARLIQYDNAESFRLHSGTGLQRVAVRYRDQRPAFYRIGPFHFTSRSLPDPDYLDFTEEEVAAMKAAPDAAKIKRKPRTYPVVGRGKSAWPVERGSWWIGNGVLTGRGPDAVLRSAQEVIGPFEMSFRLRLKSAETQFGAEVYGQGGTRGVLANLHDMIPKDSAWHDVLLRVAGHELSMRLDAGISRTIAVPSPAGGELRLKIAQGEAELDDIEIRLQRDWANGFTSTFDRRETVWRRSGTWIDHGGISCVLASSWISLKAKEGEGFLRSKRVIGPNLLVAFDIEENSDWFGWDAAPSHVHHPFDNVCVILNGADAADEMYRLEVNARNREETVLYRRGRKVAVTAQDNLFPIRHHGGHAPYAPRRNRITLIKLDGTVTAYVNGKQVLSFVDSEPLPVDRGGIGGYATNINFSHVTMRGID